MTQPTEPLVGRDHELELLGRLVDEVRDRDSSRFVVVSGEPGIGKTRVLGELVRIAEARGFLALEGSAAEFEREMPFGAVVDALDAYLAALDPGSFDRLAADGLGELAMVFPALRSLASGSDPPATAAERYLAHHAVRELLERLAARQPLVLTLDDLHWADEGSLELAQHLIRRPPQGPVVVATAFRTGYADVRVVAAMERAAGKGAVQSIELGPLSAEVAESLLAEATASHRKNIYRASGGNPFYLLQLARAGGEIVEGAAEVEAGVPASVTVSVADELRALPVAARAVAEAAAVVGDPFELDLMLAASGMKEQDALALLDQLVAGQVVRPAVVPRHFRFRHPLVRRAVYEAASPVTRLEAHRRAARALAARGATATARAHHVEQSASVGDFQAAAILREAGEATAPAAPASAARWFAGALRLLPNDAPLEGRIALLTAFAGASAATGRFEEARSALVEAIELVPVETGATRVGLIVGCAQVEQLLGRHEASHARLETALADLPSPDSADGVALRIAAATGAYYRGEYEQVGVWAASALEAARVLDDRPLIAAAAALLALGEAFSEAIGKATERCDEARNLIEAMPDQELALRLDAIVHLVAAEIMLDDLGRGVAHAQRGLAVARRSGQGELVPLLVPALTALLYSSGRLDEAGEAAERAVDGARLTGNAAALAWALGGQSTAARLAGDLDAALAAAEEGFSLAGRRGQTVIAAYAGKCLAEALQESGEPERALETMTSAGGGSELPLMPISERADALGRMVRILLDLGRADEAERAAALARQLADRLGLQRSRAPADHATAAVALAAGDGTSAVEYALASAAAADQVGVRIDAELSRILAGRALASIGERDRAVGELERAAAELDACGALRYRDEAERELGKLGRRRPRRSRPGRPGPGGIDSLTERELEVARLVTEGLSNKAIAAELFLSVKTVETHVRNVMHKLHVSSRVAVARMVEREASEATPDTGQSTPIA